LGQKLFEREDLVSWTPVRVANPIIGQRFRLLSMHSST